MSAWVLLLAATEGAELFKAAGPADAVRSALSSAGSSLAYPTLRVVFFFLRPSGAVAVGPAGTDTGGR